MWVPASPCCLPHQGCLEPSDILTVMTLRMPLTMSSYHFRTCSQGMGMGVEGIVAPGLFNIDCSSGPLGDGRVIADGPNRHLWVCPFLGESPLWSNLNGCGVDGFIHGCPWPLAFIQPLVMAWAISCQPSGI